MSDMYTNISPKETKDGVPIFSEDKYWGRGSSQELEEALEYLDKNGWEKFKLIYNSKFDFTFEENRADWRFNVPISKDFVVLDAGAGMGRTSIPLARIVKKVIAFDSSFLRVKFLKKRAEKENLLNIDVLVANFFDLPFKKESFDLIVMNGVLEWVSSNKKFKNPRNAQVECLKICKRLLKPGGYLYVGIENRFAFAYMRGLDHNGLRFTSYMPRIIANLYSRLRNRGKYNTYTHSKAEYDKLLEDSGFEKKRFYLVYPSYNLPRIIIPYEDLNILKYVMRKMLVACNFKRKLAQKMALSNTLLKFYRWGFFSFNIIARK